MRTVRAMTRGFATAETVLREAAAHSLPELAGDRGAEHAGKGNTS
jgi:hypothetical protein